MRSHIDTLGNWHNLISGVIGACTRNGLEELCFSRYHLFNILGRFTWILHSRRLYPVAFTRAAISDLKFNIFMIYAGKIKFHHVQEMRIE